MSWWGKIIGGTVGYLIGGPLGGLLGMALGHNVDRGWANGVLSKLGSVGRPGKNSVHQKERAQTAFFTASFSVMGYVTSVDGQPNRDELTVLHTVMEKMQLDQDQKQLAAKLFQQGRRPGFPFVSAVKQLKKECRGNLNLLRLFVEGLLHAAYADGELNRKEKEVLLDICKRLGFSRKDFLQIDAMVRVQHNLDVARAGGQPLSGSNQGMDIRDALAVLGMKKISTNVEIQKSYRRLMSQHHPDKLVARGLPEEMVKLAAEKTTEIRQAYDILRAHRNF